MVNPHAPSGHLTRAEQLHRIAEEISGVLLIDEAYADFIDPEIGYTSRELVEQHDNVLVLRTFSKGYSLAGLRLGYLLGNESLITPIIDKTRDSYNIDAISQRLGIAALKTKPTRKALGQGARATPTCGTTAQRTRLDKCRQ